MNDYPTPWTPDIVERFNELLAEQPMLTYSQIAARLSEVNGWYFTKNSCIGYARRIGVPSRRPAVVHKARTLKPRTKPRVPKLRLIDRQFEPKPREPKPRKSGTLRIWELEPHECKWPVDDKSPFFFCAQVRHADSPYCWHHTRVSCPSFGRGT